MTKFRDGQEEQSGTIRRDPARVRGRRDDQRTGEEAWSSPPNGATGSRQFDPARKKETRAGAAEDGPREGGHRPDAGERPSGAAQATPHRTPDLDAASGRTSRARNRRGNRAAVRATTQAGTRSRRPDRIRAAEL